MSNIQTKSEILSALYERSDWIKQVNDVEYRTRCPYCGDSVKENTGHFYIRISMNDNAPILYNCFKCNVSGVLREEQLSKLGIENPNLKNALHQLNKTSDKIMGNDINAQCKTRYFDFKVPELKLGPKTRYIEKRLGREFSIDELNDMKVITSLKDFLALNNIKTSLMHPMIVSNIEKKYVGFLTYGNSHILFRNVTETEDFRWIKYPILKESSENRVLYTIASQIDIFTKDTITINIAEGVFDVVSAKYNLNMGDENTLYVAISGKYYERVLLFLLDLGIVGDNVEINIFADNDYAFNKKAKKPTTVRYFQKALEKYKYIYGKINIFYNQLDKDIGVPIDKISLIDYQI